MFNVQRSTFNVQCSTFNILHTCFLLLAGTEHHKARTCPHCGAVIPEDAEQVCTKTTQVIDIAGILVEPEVVEHRRYTAVCPHCHRKAHAPLPSGNSKKTSYEHPVALRAVTSTDAMTANWAHLPYDFMARVSNEIINKVRGVNRVCYDISSKPPSTIEWE